MEIYSFTGGQDGHLYSDQFRSDVEIYSSTDVKNAPSDIADFEYTVERPVAFWYKGNVLVCGGILKFQRTSYKFLIL